MSYQELLRALETEVERQSRALAEGAERERDRLLEAARAGAAAARATALARLDLEVEAARSAARASRALEDERIVLGEQRRLLESLAGALEVRIGERSTPALLARLIDEAVPEALLEEGPIVVRAPAAALPAVRAHVSSAWPSLEDRARFEALAAGRSGVEVEVAGIVLDDTFAARVARVWPSLEPELARLLFAGEAPREPA